ncbi:M28 family metallopeptidase [uncultured Azohydromonas sp.]|jgi:Predicted aminopeptidases|uniref:M28 family metallopeptidase n=1 Tax=uncultured Azohydromonas sp. TaxID=487342 RepID=UPI0026131472|nr:M28 family metallopeptidase [uncultured Azohydromonas sp.]
MTPLAVVPAGADAQARKRAESDGGIRWCRFNDETLYWRPGGEAEGLPAGLLRHAGPPQQARGKLYLVVQVGNAFIDEFPAARVLINKGRYLAVDLTPAEVRALRAHEDACFSFCPLPEDAVVLRTLEAGQRREPDPALAPFVAEVSEAELMRTLSALTGFRTRHSFSADFSAAADWCRAQLESRGFTAVKTPIAVGAQRSFNVVADKAGTGSGRRLVLVTAHLDSVNLSGGAGAAAPGADDNASGVAGALEIARVLGPAAAAHDLRIVLFGGEEQGLHGSRQYVAALPAAERARVDAVINMDMIATLNTAAPTVLLEGAAVSQALMDELAAAARDHTALQVQTSLNPFNSDHVPFIDAGLPALLTIEGADSANHDVHTAGDTLDKIHAGLARQIVQTNVAVVARRVQAQAQTQAATARPASSPVVA